jgi:hypothetical protein
MATTFGRSVGPKRYLACFALQVPANNAAPPVLLEEQGGKARRQGPGTYEFHLNVIPRALVVTLAVEAPNALHRFQVLSSKDGVVRVGCFGLDPTTPTDPISPITLHLTVSARFTS